MKKKKRKKIRDKFTDALGEEILARKIVDKTQPKPKVDLTKKISPNLKLRLSRKLKTYRKLRKLKSLKLKSTRNLKKEFLSKPITPFTTKNPNVPKVKTYRKLRKLKSLKLKSTRNLKKKFSPKPITTSTTKNPNVQKEVGIPKIQPRRHVRHFAQGQWLKKSPKKIWANIWTKKISTPMPIYAAN